MTPAAAEAIQMCVVVVLSDFPASIMECVQCVGKAMRSVWEQLARDFVDGHGGPRCPVALLPCVDARATMTGDVHAALR